jgi:hypothetical protein
VPPQAPAPTDASVLARRAYEAGECILVADVTPGRAGGDLAPIPEGFWAVDLPAKTLQVRDNYERPRPGLLRDDVPPPQSAGSCCRAAGQPREEQRG